VQRDVLEEFQPHFETPEQRFAEMDTMMHSVSQVSPKFGAGCGWCAWVSYHALPQAPCGAPPS
jgi:hypothetical protein